MAAPEPLAPLQTSSLRWHNAEVLPVIRRHDGLTVCLIYSIVGVVSIIIVVFELLSVLIHNLRLHFGLIHKVWVVSELWHTMNAIDIACI